MTWLDLPKTSLVQTPQNWMEDHDDSHSGDVIAERRILLVRVVLLARESSCPSTAQATLHLRLDGPESSQAKADARSDDIQDWTLHGDKLRKVTCA